VNEVTTFGRRSRAVGIPAAIAGSRWALVVDRNSKSSRVVITAHGGAADQDRADTDVFAAVRRTTPRRPRGAARGESAPSEAGQVSQRQHVALHSEADDHPVATALMYEWCRTLAVVHIRMCTRSAAHSSAHASRSATMCA